MVPARQTTSDKVSTMTHFYFTYIVDFTKKVTQRDQFTHFVGPNS